MNTYNALPESATTAFPTTGNSYQPPTWIPTVHIWESPPGSSNISTTARVHAWKTTKAQTNNLLESPAKLPTANTTYNRHNTARHGTTYSHQPDTDTTTHTCTHTPLTHLNLSPIHHMNDETPYTHSHMECMSAQHTQPRPHPNAQTVHLNNMNGT